MSRCAAAFDASVLSAEHASPMVAETAAVEAMAAAVKGLAAARSAELGTWKDAGDRSAAAHLARTTGTSVSHAIETLDTARRLEKLPAVGAAARAGSLSASQVSAVAAPQPPVAGHGETTGTRFATGPHKVAGSVLLATNGGAAPWSCKSRSSRT